jgi:hypothetical protein
MVCGHLPRRGKGAIVEILPPYPFSADSLHSSIERHKLNFKKFGVNMYFTFQRKVCFTKRQTDRNTENSIFP